MKILLVLVFFSISSWPQKVLETRVQNSQNWGDFKKAMDDLRLEDERRGTSYIVSGALVLVGSAAGISNTQDMGTKIIYGVTTGAGIAAITYGIVNIYYGNPYNSFYESIQHTELSESQRTALVKNFMLNEKERREHIRRAQMWAHYVAGALNAYSASQEKDNNAKSVLSVLAGINLALGISFSF